MEKKILPLLHCFLWEKGSKHSWNSLHKETKRIKESERNPTLLFGFYSSSFLCLILISDMLQVINIKGNSQGKDLLKLVLFPCRTYIKLWTDPAQIISREPLLNNITLFFPVSGGLDCSSLRTEKGIPENVAVISS